MSIGNYITKSLSYEKARPAKNIQSKNVGKKVLQRCIRQLINFSSSSIGTIAHYELWPVEQCPSVLVN